MKKIDGIYVDGEFTHCVRSAFAGSSVSDPSLGSFFRIKLYEDSLLSFPNRDVEELVYISGFIRNEMEYSNDFEKLTGISLSRIPKEKDIHIDIDRSSNSSDDTDHSIEVRSLKYEINKPADIDISIKLDSGKQIDIIYTGLVHRDRYL